MSASKTFSYLLLIFAIATTYILVVYGLDWKYFLFVTTHIPKLFLFIADAAGFLIPVFLPICIFLFSKTKGSKLLSILALAVSYATVLGFVLSMAIKSLTGRVSPPDHATIFVDNSREFHFGFMREQIIGGWPSSHAMILFAIAATITTLFPSSRKIQIISFATAFCIGIGVTFGFHWLSEFIAGACFGTILGSLIGKHFHNKIERDDTIAR